jgi:hypothetical protein
VLAGCRVRGRKAADRGVVPNAVVDVAKIWD